MWFQQLWKKWNGTIKSDHWQYRGGNIQAETAETKTFSSGVIVLTYQPEKKD
jgi:hypothetical protein